MICQAYTQGERAGIPVWCEDEAGPYQAIPCPGQSWQPEGKPALRPHEHIRGGTCKMLTLFHPSTGEVRAEAVKRCPNNVLHPWLKGELSAVLDDLRAATLQSAGSPDVGNALRTWAAWGYSEVELARFTENPAEAVLMILVLDNLAGHHSLSFVKWCLEQGVALLYTPLSGSWLNLAEPVQRIIVRRSVEGHHPQTDVELMDWLRAGVRGWNADPTPFEWGGKRMARRQRARSRRHALSGADGYARRPFRGKRRLAALHTIGNGHVHDK